MFNFFRKSPKPPRQYVVQEVEVEDLMVSFILCDRSSLTKTLLGRAQYYPAFSSRDDGLLITSAEVTLYDLLATWKMRGFAMFDDILVSFSELTGATIARTKRIVQVKRPEMTE